MFLFPESIKITSDGQLSKASAPQWTLFQDLMLTSFPKMIRYTYKICNGQLESAGNFPYATIFYLTRNV